MCLACDMEALWFAGIDARANIAGETELKTEQPEELPFPLPAADGSAPLLPPPEEGGASVEGTAAQGRSNESARRRQRSPRRFACEGTSSE